VDGRVARAGARPLKLTWQARTTTDPIDVRKLVELAWVHLLPVTWIPGAESLALPQLLRGRMFLLRQRAVIWNAPRHSRSPQARTVPSPARDL
jgi:hypothetical protein